MAALYGRMQGNRGEATRMDISFSGIIDLAYLIEDSLPDTGDIAGDIASDIESRIESALDDKLAEMRDDAVSRIESALKDAADGFGLENLEYAASSAVTLHSEFYAGQGLLEDLRAEMEGLQAAIDGSPKEEEPKQPHRGAIVGVRYGFDPDLPEVGPVLAVRTSGGDEPEIGRLWGRRLGSLLLDNKIEDIQDVIGWEAVIDRTHEPSLLVSVEEVPSPPVDAEGRKAEDLLVLCEKGLYQPVEMHPELFGGYREVRGGLFARPGDSVSTASASGVLAGWTEKGSGEPGGGPLFATIRRSDGYRGGGPDGNWLADPTEITLTIPAGLPEKGRKIRFADLGAPTGEGVVAFQDPDDESVVDVIRTDGGPAGTGPLETYRVARDSILDPAAA